MYRPSIYPIQGVCKFEIPVNTPILKYLNPRDPNYNIIIPKIEMVKNRIKTCSNAGDRFSVSDSDSDYENK